MIESYSNLKVIGDINIMMINYESLDESLKRKIGNCSLNLESTIERAQSNGNVFMINKVSFGYRCEEGQVLHQNRVCYHKCPKEFTELGFACKKKNSKKLKIYGDLKSCERETQNSCDSYFDGAVNTEQCSKFSTKILKTICLVDCPSGYIDNGDVCLKRFSNHLSNETTFNWNDLYHN